MKQSPSSTVVLDLSNVRFVDSTGVGAVVSVLKIMGGSKQLVLAGLNETVQQLFKLTRMDKVFPIFPDVQHALNSRNATSAPGSA
jgi:anti-sigma B factor antagonist